MKNFITYSAWKIIEETYSPQNNKISESIFSLGNGRMGGRGGFEERFSGPTLQGNYVAGVYYPDKTRVGWWKNGYPEYFAKVPNAANWLGIDVLINGKTLDLAEMQIESFRRELDMKEGALYRHVTASFPNGEKITISSHRFLSIVKPEIGALRYSIELHNSNAVIVIKPYIDFDIVNEDSNYNEKFWDEVTKEVSGTEGYVIAETRKTLFHVCSGMKYRAYIDGNPISFEPTTMERKKYIASEFSLSLKSGQNLVVEKYGVNLTSEFEEKSALLSTSKKSLEHACQFGFDALFEEHVAAWTHKWETSDIKIDGDVAAQQGIRFNIFQLNQTYTGKDANLNIGPKGFTGEKYGGSTYWDTEAYCLPFYLATAEPQVSRNLLHYRHRQLDRAIENAAKLGFNKGAALYPMVTMNGEECHNEWEITFEEIHRNGAIAYAIYDYIRYTGDDSYLAPFGFEVLLGISRFWGQRVNWSNERQKYVMLGVTGPNEYENNVNNNWHTSNMAVWTLKYTISVIQLLGQKYPEQLDELKQKWNFDTISETAKWTDIIEKMYFPYDEKRKIHLQQDGFLDKELVPVAQLNAEELPLNKKWSWDRILRSCYIKQADVLQSIYWFEDDYSTEEIQRHFDFYEPITVHESSLSSCIHAILAASIGRSEKAYEFYLRTARLDLDDYNNDSDDGLHITSMGGTWMAFVIGFGGLRVRNNRLILNPFMPGNWKGYSFKINFRGAHLEIKVNSEGTVVTNHSSVAISVTVFDNDYEIAGNNSIEINKL